MRKGVRARALWAILLLCFAPPPSCSAAREGSPLWGPGGADKLAKSTHEGGEARFASGGRGGGGLALEQSGSKSIEDRLLDVASALKKELNDIESGQIQLASLRPSSGPAAEVGEVEVVLTGLGFKSALQAAHRAVKAAKNNTFIFYDRAKGIEAGVEASNPMKYEIISEVYKNHRDPTKFDLWDESLVWLREADTGAHSAPSLILGSTLRPPRLLVHVDVIDGLYLAVTPKAVPSDVELRFDMPSQLLNSADEQKTATRGLTESSTLDLPRGREMALRELEGATKGKADLEGQRVALISVHFFAEPVLRNKKPLFYRVYPPPSIRQIQPSEVPLSGNAELLLFGSSLFASDVIKVRFVSLTREKVTKVVDGEFVVINAPPPDSSTSTASPTSSRSSPEDPRTSDSAVATRPAILCRVPPWNFEDEVSVWLSFNGQHFHRAMNGTGPPALLTYRDPGSLLGAVAKAVVERPAEDASAGAGEKDLEKATSAKVGTPLNAENEKLGGGGIAQKGEEALIPAWTKGMEKDQEGEYSRLEIDDTAPSYAPSSKHVSDDVVLEVVKESKDKAPASNTMQVAIKRSGVGAYEGKAAETESSTFSRLLGSIRHFLTPLSKRFSKHPAAPDNDAAEPEAEQRDIGTSLPGDARAQQRTEKTPKPSDSAAAEDGPQRLPTHQEKPQDLLTIVLADADGNEYVLSKPSDYYKVKADSRFVRDLSVLCVAIAICTCVAGLLRLPTPVGDLVAGIIIGPKCLALIQQPVQMTSVAQLGSALLLFDLGLHFSLRKILKVRRAALWIGLIAPLVFILIFVYAALKIGTSLSEAIVLGFFIMMSSTALCLQDITSRRAADQHESEVIVGALLLQDLSLSLILASFAIPTPGHQTFGGLQPFLSHSLITNIIVYFSVALVLCLGIVLPWPRALTVNRQILLVGWALLFGQMAEMLGLSLELGTFLAGVVCARLLPHRAPLQGAGNLEVALESPAAAIATLRDFTVAFFFATIGLAVDVVLVYDNLLEILALSTTIGVIKAIVFALCLKVARYDWRTAARVGLILCQLGEFSFVTLEKAASLNLLGRKVYLLLISTTGVNLVLAPICLKLVSLIPQGYNADHPPTLAPYVSFGSWCGSGRFMRSSCGRICNLSGYSRLEGRGGMSPSTTDDSETTSSQHLPLPKKENLGTSVIVEMT